MTGARRRRAAWATGLSLVVHLLALTGMVVGLKVITAPPDSRVIELELIPPPRLRPKPVRRSSGRQRAASISRTPPASTPRPEPSVPAPAERQTPATAPGAQAALQADSGSKGLSASASGRMGCDDALGLHMKATQRQACVDNLARLAQSTRPLALDIPDAKKIDYDRYERCRDLYRNDPTVPPSRQINPKTGKPYEPGYLPSFAECPMGDRLW